jgi:hypothetical protein
MGTVAYKNIKRIHIYTQIEEDFKSTQAAMLGKQHK